MSQRIDHSLLLLDDQVFAVCLNSNYPPDRAPGFLLRRSPEPPFSMRCVGSFDHHPSDGRWSACITAGQGTEATCVGSYADRMNAIAALWRNRHIAGHAASR